MSKPSMITLLAALSFSTSAMAAPSFGEPLSGSPLEKRDGDIRYISGGIGNEEKAMLEQQRSSYNLWIESALSTGHYISDAYYTITNKSGDSVFSAQGDGPFFYVALPQGSYKVTADWKGQSNTKSATVGTSGHSEINFYFKPDGENGLTERPYTTPSDDASSSGAATPSAASPSSSTVQPLTAPSNTAPSSISPSNTTIQPVTPMGTNGSNHGNYPTLQEGQVLKVPEGQRLDPMPVGQ